MRLWLKFVLATGAVILVCLVVAGLLAGNLIRRGFDHLVQAQEENYLQELAPILADYYERSNSWDGLQNVLGRRGAGMGSGVRAGMGPMAGIRVVLLDVSRRVVADTHGQALGQTVPPEVWDGATPIVVQGQEVGRLAGGASLAGARTRSAIERTFLTSMVWALVWAGLAGAVAAIVVATVLALQITAPARKLTRAARRVASGDLEHRVDIDSHDELGEVGDAFNDMAAGLAQQEELRQHMVADIAHELRTPLSVMQVELDSLQDGLTEPTPEVISSLREEVDLLSRLVQDLRLLSRVEAGRLPLELQSVALAGLAQQVAQQVSTSAERKGVRLEASVPEDLPAVRADPDRLQQVLLNLLDNALRHTPAGGAVRLSAQAEGAFLHLQVADTGEGIAPEDLSHVFDRFYRADASRSRASGGSGLGLTIARGLIEAMGGRIWAESTPGQGAAFHFTLPAG